MAEYVEIFEVGPRDGLQNEEKPIPTADKIALVDLLSTAGFRRIEVSSFVNPAKVPQLADASEVFGGISRKKSVLYAALTPNMRGFEAAVAAGANEVAIFASASEGFSQANINCSIAESLARYKPVLEAARHVDMPVRGYVSCVTDCPYDGSVSPDKVAEVSEALFAMGCYEVSLADTLGKATPETTAKMLLAVLKKVPAHRLAGHFHDTDGRALDNIDVALSLGVRVFDASVGGLGGCPFAPGAAGNVATAAVQEHVLSKGFETRLNADILARAASLAQSMRS